MYIYTHFHARTSTFMHMYVYALKHGYPSAHDYAYLDNFGQFGGMLGSPELEGRQSGGLKLARGGIP